MSLTLSKYQLPTLERFVNLKGYMSIREAMKMNQTTFGSFYHHRKYIAYRPGHGFHITKLGRAAWEEMHSTSIERADPSRPLTSYFDPSAYGITMKPAKLTLVKRKAA